VKSWVVFVLFARSSCLEFFAGYKMLDRPGSRSNRPYAPGSSFGFRQDFMVSSLALTRDFCW
jgi:hypothetical protein